MPNILDLLDELGAPNIVIEKLAILLLIFLIVFAIYKSVKCIKTFIGNRKVIDVSVVDEIALIYRTPDKRQFPHALFKLKITNLSNHPVSITDIEFETNSYVYNKSTPINRVDKKFIGIPVEAYVTGVKDPSPSCITITDEFDNNLWLAINDSKTVYVYFYSFLKIPSHEKVTLLFVINNKKIAREITIRQGLPGNAYLS